MSLDTPTPPYNSLDPTAQFLNSSCLDLLMIELVPMAYRVVNEVDSASDDRAVYSASKEGSVSTKTGGAVGGTGNGIGSGGRKMDEDEERDAVFFRLESLGYRVGQGLVERYVFNTTIHLIPYCQSIGDRRCHIVSCWQLVL